MKKFFGYTKYYSAMSMFIMFSVMYNNHNNAVILSYVRQHITVMIAPDDYTVLVILCVSYFFNFSTSYYYFFTFPLPLFNIIYGPLV